MRDRLLSAEWLNKPIHNPTQNIYMRFVKQPQSGMKDYMDEWNTDWKAFENKALKTRIEEI